MAPWSCPVWAWVASGGASVASGVLVLVTSAAAGRRRGLVRCFAGRRCRLRAGREQQSRNANGREKDGD